MGHVTRNGQWRSQGHSFGGGGQNGSAEGASHPRGVREMGMLPREILKSRIPQMRFPAFYE